MKSIRLGLSQNPYDIMLERGGLAYIGERIRPLVRGKNALVVTDENVAPLYLQTVKTSLESAGFRACAKIVPVGEKFKTTSTYLDIIDTIGIER
ncbi:MAG: 3-dehydroquinate synthase, partial [Clostridia bacterium]|nr:3-dehydroquinate synthase [Clostridia bacterium]